MGRKNASLFFSVPVVSPAVLLSLAVPVSPVEELPEVVLPLQPASIASDIAAASAPPATFKSF